MFTFIKNIYLNIIKKSFVNKILFANILICTITLSLLTYILSSNISDMLIKKEIKFNNQILNIVDDYYKQKQLSAVHLLESMYMQRATHFPVISFIRNDFDLFTIDYINTKLAFDDFISTGYSYDSDIRSIEIYKKFDNTIISSFRHRSPIQEFLDPNKISSSLEEVKTNGFRVSSSKLLQSSVKSVNEYTFSANILDEWLKTNLGVILINYDSTAIEKSYLQYKQDIKGYILILTPDGDVIFDSSRKYYGNKYPNFEAIMNSKKDTKAEKNSIINIKISNVDKVIIAGVISKKELLVDIKKTKNTIYLVAVLCFVFTILLTTLGTSHFTKRIKIIKVAMKQLRKGNLSTRIPISSNDDEFNEISTSFNRMSIELEDYINKVYISNIKQKSAELSALQAQINPHFLYNTLESIRMRALTDGNTEIGDMICLLATYFRGTIKQETIIDIKDEIKYCKIYLELFNIRYDGKLLVSYEIDKNIQHYGIVKHILQPLIENYVVHGFNHQKDNNTILIKAYQQDSDIYVKIEDNGCGIEEEKFVNIKKCLNSHEKINDSIGLLNVNSRIKIIYGDNYGLDIISQPNIGTKITIKLGAKTRKELINSVQGINS